MRAVRAQAHADGKCRRKYTTGKPPQGGDPARVKRRGKSSPPGPQGTGQEKPHAVQDITGETGRRSGLRQRRKPRAGMTPGISRTWRKPGAGSQGPARGMVVDPLATAGDKIRLTKIRKSSPSQQWEGGAIFTSAAASRRRSDSRI